jgi:hypothetical protein
MSRGEAPLDRFEAKVLRSGSCHLWTGSKTRDGYGSFALDGSRPILAHRAAWLLLRGGIPEGLCVLHACDTPSCVNPAHLWLGSQTDNIRDMDAKGRRNTDPRPVGNRPRGEQNPMHKLTWPQVTQIRQEFSTGASKRGLAARFGVSRPVISGIVEGKSWVALHGPIGAEDE